jgi:hypothetical protein
MTCSGPQFFEQTLVEIQSLEFGHSAFILGQNFARFDVVKRGKSLTGSYAVSGANIDFLYSASRERPHMRPRRRRK